MKRSKYGVERSRFRTSERKSVLYVVPIDRAAVGVLLMASLKHHLCAALRRKHAASICPGRRPVADPSHVH